MDWLCSIRLSGGLGLPTNQEAAVSAALYNSQVGKGVLEGFPNDLRIVVTGSMSARPVLLGASQICLGGSAG